MGIRVLENEEAIRKLITEARRHGSKQKDKASKTQTGMSAPLSEL